MTSRITGERYFTNAGRPPQVKTAQFGVGIPVLMITVAIAEGDELLWRKQASVQKAEKAPKPYPHVSRVSPPYMCFHFTL